jgi:hypothetical protein
MRLDNARGSGKYRVKTKIIWRCKRTSIRGDSGAALLQVGRQHKDLVHGWHIVGFQGHEIAPNRLRNSVDCIAKENFFKVALPLSEGMQTQFHPVAPN